MSRIRSKDTTIELTVRRLVHAHGLRYRKHQNGLPGRPDLVFARARVVVFMDGDFWHGWQFSRWKHKMSSYWKQKIDGNRKAADRSKKLFRDGFSTA